jgi:outer membrane murein-binding lipoprotein Lpp
MKPELLLAAIIVLASALAGCTSIRIRTPAGAEVSFASTKNIKLEQLTIDPATGWLLVTGLESDASSVVRAQGQAAATIAKAAITP